MSALLFPGQGSQVVGMGSEFHTNFKILCWTPPTPSLPYITAKGADSGLFFRAIQKALRALPKDTRIKLMIKDLIKIPKEDYFI